MSSIALEITPYYALALILILVGLTVNVIRMRYTLRVSLLDGGNPDLTKAMRAHGNFIEYVPLCLLLIALCELNGSVDWIIHALGAALVLSRLFHATSILKSILLFRQIGMTFTFTCLVFSAIALLFSTFSS